MSSPRASGAPGPIIVQDAVPKLLRDLIHERTGLHFDASRLDAMIEKLEPRAAARGCRSYLDYYYILKYDPDADEEWRRVMDAFSVQETYFWRESDQIRLLVEVLVPAWFARTAAPLRIWSAACATGDEPYSLAIALLEAGWGGHPIEILASDASETALERARAGVYRERSFRVLPPALKEKYFFPSEDGYTLRPEVRVRVAFRWANLMQLEALPEAAEAQVIFCRNVFIYFSIDSIKQVVESFAERIPAAGHLFVGASESLIKLTDKFRLEQIHGAFVYVRSEEA